MDSPANEAPVTMEDGTISSSDANKSNAQKTAFEVVELDCDTSERTTAEETLRVLPPDSNNCSSNVTTLSVNGGTDLPLNNYLSKGKDNSHPEVVELDADSPKSASGNFPEVVVLDSETLEDSSNIGNKSEDIEGSDATEDEAIQIQEVLSTESLVKMKVKVTPDIKPTHSHAQKFTPKTLKSSSKPLIVISPRDLEDPRPSKSAKVQTPTEFKTKLSQEEMHKSCNYTAEPAAADQIPDVISIHSYALKSTPPAENVSIVHSISQSDNFKSDLKVSKISSELVPSKLLNKNCPVITLADPQSEVSKSSAVQHPEIFIGGDAYLSVSKKTPDLLELDAQASKSTLMEVPDVLASGSVVSSSEKVSSNNPNKSDRMTDIIIEELNSEIENNINETISDTMKRLQSSSTDACVIDVTDESRKKRDAECQIIATDCITESQRRPEKSILLALAKKLQDLDDFARMCCSADFLDDAEKICGKVVDDIVKEAVEMSSVYRISNTRSVQTDVSALQQFLQLGMARINQDNVLNILDVRRSDNNAGNMPSTNLLVTEESGKDVTAPTVIVPASDRNVTVTKYKVSPIKFKRIVKRHGYITLRSDESATPPAADGADAGRIDFVGEDFVKTATSMKPLVLQKNKLDNSTKDERKNLASFYHLWALEHRDKLKSKFPHEMDSTIDKMVLRHWRRMDFNEKNKLFIDFEERKLKSLHNYTPHHTETQRMSKTVPARSLDDIVRELMTSGGSSDASQDQNIKGSHDQEEQVPEAGDDPHGDVDIEEHAIKTEYLSVLSSKSADDCQQKGHKRKQSFADVRSDESDETKKRKKQNSGVESDALDISDDDDDDVDDQFDITFDSQQQGEQLGPGTSVLEAEYDPTNFEIEFDNAEDDLDEKSVCASSRLIFTPDDAQISTEGASENQLGKRKEKRGNVTNGKQVMSTKEDRKTVGREITFKESSGRTAKISCMYCDKPLPKPNRSELYRHLASRHFSKDIEKFLLYTYGPESLTQCHFCGVRKLSKKMMVDHCGQVHDVVENFLPESAKISKKRIW